MRSRNTHAANHSPCERRVALDKRKLVRDVISIISRFLIERKEFIGRDGQQYSIMGVHQEETESEGFIKIIVKLDAGHEVAAKYAIILQEISH